MAKEVKFFSLSLYYKRFFSLDAKTKTFVIQNEEISKKSQKVPFNEILYIESVQEHS